ncbi:hypothetical protein LTR29_017846 [Friedmanniomyces endolithicus]|nr:hypothetical protein LTS09_017744 [Friedmanniomyces endolithicus]KAK0926483.1 hypothetical protein LTR29_017846 [Friedmanniomyces endolithicus]
MDFAPGVRDFDKANVDRLVNIFRLEGCQRDDPPHFVPGLIARESLGPEWQQLLEPQRLSLPTSVVLRCLHGKHRILAAREVLPPHEQWWNVALYDDALPDILSANLVEQYKNELRFSDGDVFRSYRQAQMAENELNMRRWEARLSETKLRNLRQIENAHHGGIVRALDALLPLPGLWQDFHLGSWNRVLPMHIWQVVLHQMLDGTHILNRSTGNFEISRKLTSSVDIYSGWTTRYLRDTTDRVHSPTSGSVTVSL